MLITCPSYILSHSVTLSIVLCELIAISVIVIIIYNSKVGGKKLLAKRLRELRKEKNYTQTTLARMLGVAANTISNYEQGKRKPQYDLLVAIAEIMDTSTDYLLGKTDVK